METKYINMIGGPGCGKTTLAHGLTYYLATQGRSVEYVGGAARDYIYRGIEIDDNIQHDIADEQLWMLSIPQGKVDYIITDCPLFTQAYYCKQMGLQAIANRLLQHATTDNNINFYLERSYKFNYNPVNRLHTEEEAINIDNALRLTLDHLHLPYLLTRDLSSLTYQFSQNGPYAKGA